ncbi:hypothetical protein [Bacillus sp. FJAT-45037]|uniref:hypothetical protein n=1 Tax=Bacillus sp. FJAT-45037 TaxID=2011007 RepID=UPI0012FD2659|nr:hypothetical protein [Bacillus sp. FJAT-45037]
MALFFGGLSICLSILFAIISGLPLTSKLGLKFPYEGYLFLGLTSTFFYYFYILNNLKSSFSYSKFLYGIPLAIISFFAIMYIQYNVAYFSSDGFIHNEAIGNTLKSQMSFADYILISPKEGVFFMLGSFLSLFIFMGRRIICYECKKGFLEEQWLFDSDIDDYLKDVKLVKPLFIDKDTNKFKVFVEERQMFTKFHTQQKNMTYSFYQLTCRHCESKYIVSKRNRDIGDKTTSKKSYKILMSNTKNT